MGVVQKTCLFLLFLAVVPYSICQFPAGFPGAPVTLTLERNWKIPEDEAVGTRVAQAKISDEPEGIIFTIEPSAFKDGSKYFRVDRNGAIYLNESMKGRAGQQFYLYVTAATSGNGGLRSKAEVWVQIVSTSTSYATQLPTKPIVPTDLGHIGGSLPPGIVHPFPPGFNFPGMPNINNKVENVTEEELNPQVTPTIISLPPTTTKKPGREKIKPIYPPHVNHKEGINEAGGVPPLSGNTIEAQTAVSTGIEEEKKTNTTLYALIPLGLVILLVPLIAGTLYFIKRKKATKKRPTKETQRKESVGVTNSNVTMSSEGESPKALTAWIGKRAESNRYESWDPDAIPPMIASRWEFPRHHLQIGGILGEGCFGQVWRCEALNIDGAEGTTTVAVKTLKESAGERERSDLLSELEVMKMLDPHPNVVRLLGACTEKEPIFVIMEYAPVGKLQSFLRNSRAEHYYGNLHADSRELSSKDLTSFAHQVARGMEYLSSKGIIHRDLAARNVLLDKERVCKVADFGFARDVVENNVYERKSDGRLPIRWMAPEALYDNIFTSKTDVWSFGVLMWEIVTLGSTPYPGMAAGEVMRKVRDGYRLEKPEHCMRELYNIMFYTWAQSPEERPSFADLENLLGGLLFSETDYIQLDLFPDHDYYNMSQLSPETEGEKL